MDWNSLPLTLSEARIEELLALYEPVKRHLEQQIELPPSQLEALRKGLSGAIGQAPKLLDLLKRRKEGGGPSRTSPTTSQSRGA